MPSFRLDDYACVFSAPAAIPNSSAPRGCVFRPFNDLDEAMAYADKVCEFFTNSGAPAPVFVVRGPTSTTDEKYEVVDATSSYIIEYRSLPPDNSPRHTTFADIIVANNAKRPLEEQEKVHFMAACDMLAPKTNKELRELSIASCRDFLARGVGIANSTADGQPKAEQQPQLLVQFLAHEWPQSHAEDIEALFRGYIRAGHVPLAARLNHVAKDGSYVGARSPLEYAVLEGRVHAVRALIVEGADFASVPEEPVVLPNGTVPAKEARFLDFVRSQSHLGEAVVDLLYAYSVEAVMHRHISDQALLEPADVVGRKPAESTRSRRAGL